MTAPTNFYANVDWHEPSAPATARLPLSWAPAAAAFILAITTLTFKEAMGPQIGSLDTVAIVKLLVRVLTVAVLGGALLFLWADEMRTAIGRALAPFFLFVFWAGISTAWSPLPKITFGQSLSLLALVCIAASFALLCRTRVDFSRHLAFLNGVLFSAASLTLLIHFFLPGIGRITRESQGLMHPTNAAACSCIGILLTLGGMWVCRWQRYRWLLPPILMVHALVIALAVNRMGPAAMAAVALVLMLFYAPREKLAVAAIVTSLLLAFYVACDPGFKAMEPVTAKLAESSMRGQSTKQIKRLSGREILWKKMWQSHQQSPWIGHGYFVTSATGAIHVWGQTGNRTAHNFVLQVLVTSGRIGLGLCLLGLLVPITVIIRGLIHTPFDRALLGFLGLLLCWFVLWGIFNETIAGPITPETVAFFVILGCGLGVACRRTAAWSRAAHLSLPDPALARGGA